MRSAIDVAVAAVPTGVASRGAFSVGARSAPGMDPGTAETRPTSGVENGRSFWNSGSVFDQLAASVKLVPGRGSAPVTA